MELQPGDGPRSSLSIRPRFGRCSGISLEFARRFVEGIEKLAGNMSGDCQKKTIGLAIRMLEAVGLAGLKRQHPSAPPSGPIKGLLASEQPLWTWGSSRGPSIRACGGPMSGADLFEGHPQPLGRISISSGSSSDEVSLHPCKKSQGVLVEPLESLPMEGSPFAVIELALAHRLG
ncbi:hypothetical protein B296_00047973 [Ensete ventricosum]|uniref:Uncharacterized protein n=1 Tax=Ensete ventricosum TaxID=4639 RepID=A0A426Y042_ENSVE|nr:hypothetical protein B296_00047973 [Ensete ventricosum]